MNRNKTDKPTGKNDTAEFNANLQHWKALIDELPAVRTDKVQRARQAIEEHRYDDDGVIEVTLERLCSEMKPN